MKTRISVSVDRKTVKLIERALALGFFRNKSHFVEHAINFYVRERWKDE